MTSVDLFYNESRKIRPHSEKIGVIVDGQPNTFFELASKVDYYKGIISPDRQYPFRIHGTNEEEYPSYDDLIDSSLNVH